MSAIPDRAKKPLFVSLQVKLIVGFTLLFTIVFAGVFYWFYTINAADALANVKADMTNSIQGAVKGINGAEFQALVQEGQVNQRGLTDDPRYQDILNWLAKVHDVQPNAYPYTYIAGPEKNGKKTNYFIVDYLQIADPSRAAGFKEQYTLKSGESQVGLDHLAYQLTPYSDQWGNWVSSYAPIKNGQGQVVGGLGVDFRADYVYQVENEIKAKMASAFAVTYIIFFGLILLISRGLTRRVGRLTHAAVLIGDGDYEQDLTSLQARRLRDEMSQMAEVFGGMAQKIAHREQTLAKKVEALTIEIDEVKREKEVSEIVDSDFFQGLQDRAKLMRERRSGEPSVASSQT